MSGESKHDASNRQVTQILMELAVRIGGNRPRKHLGMTEMKKEKFNEGRVGILSPEACKFMASN